MNRIAFALTTILLACSSMLAQQTPTTYSFQDVTYPKDSFVQLLGVNNAETIATVPHVIEMGAEAYSAVGSPRNGGTRLFGVSGHVERPGVYELPMGYNLKKIVYDVAGGVRGGRKLKAVVPGGSSIREGAFVAPSVICMPPMFVNVGAYVDEGTMIDSHALVGSCAQIGKRVHLSAAAQIGGVLEPVNAAPVVIEDDVLVGGNCGVYEGTWVRARAVLGAGTILTRSTPLYDLVRGEIYHAAPDAPLEVPENALVVPGSRAVRKGKGADWDLSLYTPVIVKYRDEKTERGIELEDWLR